MTISQVTHGISRARRRRSGGVLALPLVLLIGAVALAGGYIAYVLWPRWPGPPIGPEAPAIPITVANVRFNVPPASIRVPVQRRPGAHERIDLAFQWPSLDPPDPNAKPSAASSAAARIPLERIFVTIASAGDTLPPAERLATIYPRYTVPAAVDGPGGLSMLAFRDGTPYQGEDLIYDTTSPAHFLVRCSRKGPGPTPGTCLYERRIASADVVMRFPRDWLTDWPTVADNIDRLIASIQPKE